MSVISEAPVARVVRGGDIRYPTLRACGRVSEPMHALQLQLTQGRTGRSRTPLLLNSRAVYPRILSWRPDAQYTPSPTEESAEQPALLSIVPGRKKSSSFTQTRQVVFLDALTSNSLHTESWLHLSHAIQPLNDGPGIQKRKKKRQKRKKRRKSS